VRWFPGDILLALELRKVPNTMTSQGIFASQNEWDLIIRPGVLGGAAGAYLLASFPGDVLKPYVSFYLLIMGGIILFLMGFVGVLIILLSLRTIVMAIL